MYASLAITCALLTISLHRSGKAAKQQTSVNATSSPLKAMRIPGLKPLLLIVVAYMVAFYGLYAFIGAHLTNVLGMTTALAGLFSLAYGVGFGAIAPMDRLIDRHGKTRIAPMVFALLTLSYLIIAIVSDAAAPLIAMCVVWGAANHLGLNLIVGSLTTIDPQQRTSILGLYSAITYGSMCIGTILFKPLFDQFGFSAAAAASALCILPATIFSLIKHRRTRITLI